MTNPTDHARRERARSIAKLIYTEFPDIQASQLEGPTRRTFEDAEMRGYPRQEVAMRLAKAIIEALYTPAIPDGWRLVPVEATEAMLEMMCGPLLSYQNRDIERSEDALAQMWRYALTAAPSPSAMDRVEIRREAFKEAMKAADIEVFEGEQAWFARDKIVAAIRSLSEGAVAGEEGCSTN